MEKKYYLPTWQSIAIGVLFILLGLSLSLSLLMMELFEGSFWSMLESYFEIIITPIGIFFGMQTLIFLILGLLTLKSTGRILRVKLDSEGFYFKTIKSGDIKNFFQFIEKNPKLEFIPYKNIKHVELINQKEIHLITKSNESPDLRNLKMLRLSDKETIVREIQERIQTA